MSLGLTEDEMREALFGTTGAKNSSTPAESSSSIAPARESKQSSGAIKLRTKSRPLSPKLRVTLSVTREYEGEPEMFIYDADTLSTLIAEQDARKSAKDKRFKYFKVISIQPIS